MRELRELGSGRQLGPGQLLMLLAQGKAPPLLMEDIEATVQFVDKYGEEGLIGVDEQVRSISFTMPPGGGHLVAAE